MEKQDVTDLTITLELDDGTELECDVLARYPVNGQQYIALAPVGSDDIIDDIFLYRFAEDADGEPVLTNIESDEEYDAAADRFDEILDEMEFDDIVDAEDEEE